MAGYDGYSKSNNAVNAEDRGFFPASVLAKKLKVSSKAIKEFLAPDEWHHTSKMYNKTDYYDGRHLLAAYNDDFIFIEDHWDFDDGDDDIEEKIYNFNNAKELYNKLKNFKEKKEIRISFDTMKEVNEYCAANKLNIDGDFLIFKNEAIGTFGKMPSNGKFILNYLK